MVDGTTTGGEGGSTIRINNLNDFKVAASNNLPKIIEVDGIITGTEIANVGNNTTIIGINGGTFDGVGLYLQNKNNIIIRNIKIQKTLGRDCIGIREGSHHIWVDHCDLSQELNNPNDADGEMYDGCLDISQGSFYITVSNCKIHDAKKAMLITHNAQDGLNMPQKVTLHNNYFYNNGERSPAIRRGIIHCFNNYYKDIGGNCITINKDTLLRVERNYFDNVRLPVVGADTADPNVYYPSIPVGTVCGLEDNIYKGSSETRLWASSKNAWEPPYEYKSILLNSENVPTVIMTGAGVQ